MNSSLTKFMDQSSSMFGFSSFARRGRAFTLRSNPFAVRENQFTTLFGVNHSGDWPTSGDRTEERFELFFYLAEIIFEAFV
jgi:hypothetical protein